MRSRHVFTRSTGDISRPRMRRACSAKLINANACFIALAERCGNALTYLYQIAVSLIMRAQRRTSLLISSHSVVSVRSSVPAASRLRIGRSDRRSRPWRNSTRFRGEFESASISACARKSDDRRPFLEFFF